MIRFLLDFIAIGLTAAIITPIAKRVVKRRLIRWAPTAMDILDREMPQLFGNRSGQELTDMLRTQLETLTGEPWSNSDLDQVFELYDPRITADKAL